MRWAKLDGVADIDAWVIREPDRQTYRGRVSCPDPACGVGLNWRKRSKDGKAPTFYGNHLDGCKFKTESEEQVAERELEEVDAVINTCEEMKIRLDTPSRQRPKTKDEPGSGGSPGKTHQHNGNDRSTRAGSTGLRPLLRKLINSPTFREDRMPLVLSDGTRTTVADGCHHVNDFELSGETCIVWGKIKTTKADWINAGFRHEKLPSVRVWKDAAPDALESAGVQDIDDLIGWYFLVEGKFGETSAGSPYVSLQDAKRIAFLSDPAEAEAESRSAR